MKKFLLLLALSFSLVVSAQNKKKKALITRTYQLSHTVFGSKDSLQLEDLFATQLSYGHSRGKIESRAEAIRGILGNTSVYRDTAVSDINVLIEKKTALVRHSFVAKELKKDGSVAVLNFTILLVWVKDDGRWKLLARQAVALPRS